MKRGICRGQSVSGFGTYHTGPEGARAGGSFSPDSGSRLGVTGFPGGKSVVATEQSPFKAPGYEEPRLMGQLWGKHRNRKTLCYFKNPACQPGCFVPHFPSPQSMRFFRDFGCSIFKAFRTYIDDSRSYWVINIRALALKSSFRELK